MRNNFTTQRGPGVYRIEINAEASLLVKEWMRKLSGNNAAHAAVNGDLCAGDIAGCIAGEEDCCTSKIANVADAAEWGGMFELFNELIALWVVFQQAGIDEARADGVDANAIWRQVAGHNADHLQDAAFARTVWAGILECDKTADGCHADDAAALAVVGHFLGDGLSNDELTVEVDIDDVFPGVEVDIEERHFFIDTGIIDENINAAELLVCFVDHGFDGIDIGNVASMANDGLVWCKFFDLSGHFVQIGLSAADEHQISACSGKILCELCANATTSAGDDDFFTF